MRPSTSWEPARWREGGPQSASEAWARVTPGSRFAPRAILGSMQIQMERGRFAEAEQIIKDALDDPRIDRSSLPILLGPIYCLQGRLEETLRLIESRWEALNQAGEGASEAAINLVRAHIDLRRGVVPIEVVGSALDQAGRMAPEDDRIWLGKANLAIRAGSFDEAARWIDACLRRRPEDGPVWRARLDWAVASNRVAEAREALKHLPAEVSTPAQIHKLAAWFAAQRGDVESERRALERLIAADPADFVALDRLAELAVKNGQPDRAAELRREKTEIESAHGAIPETPRTASAEPRRGGDGPPGRAARPTVRGQGLPDRWRLPSTPTETTCGAISTGSISAPTRSRGRDIPWPICSRLSSATTKNRDTLSSRSCLLVFGFRDFVATGRRTASRRRRTASFPSRKLVPPSRN